MKQYQKIEKLHLPDKLEQRHFLHKEEWLHLLDHIVETPKRWSSITHVSTSIEGKRACTKEHVDLYEDSYYGFPIKEEGPKANTIQIGVPRITST